MPNGYWFEWNGIKSNEIASNSGDNTLNDTDFKLIVRKPIAIPSPARKTNVYKVPGRSGDIVIPTDYWENIQIQIDLFVFTRAIGSDNLHRFCRAIAEWLNGGLTPGGYNDLALCHSDGYYEAYYTGPYDVENLLYNYGRATITFNASPKHYTGYDAVRYRQSTDPEYDGQHQLKYDSSTSEWYVEVENDTAHNARPRITIRQPASISGYGSQVYGMDLKIGTTNDSYYIRYYFKGRAFPEGKTNFRNFAIDSEMYRMVVTNSVIDTSRTGRHIKTTGANCLPYVERGARVNAPEQSDFPWMIAGNTTRIGMRYAKWTNGTPTYYADAPELIAVETRRWTL